MRSILLYIFVCAAVAGCNNQTDQSIHFKAIEGSMFNFMADSSFIPPDAQTAAERKRAFDSCMGEGYEPNAIFMKTKDTFMIGSIVNRNTMRVVKNIPFQTVANTPIFSFVEKPCYNKMKLDITPAEFMKTVIALKVPGADSVTNKEFNFLFSNAKNAELEMSFWVNLELNDGLGRMLDTTGNTELLAYKNSLLDTANMVLIRSTSVTKISFYVHTTEPLPMQLQRALANSPLTDISNSDIKVALSMINDHMFKVEFNGIFQIIGQFMQAKLE